MKNEKTINIITLGKSFVGKTSIIYRITKNQFNEHLLSTQGFISNIIFREYKKKNLILSLNFIDTAGQEKYLSMTNSYIRNSQIVLLVFDDIDSLNELKNRWYNYYKENTNIKNPKFILIGNKSDLFENRREEIIKQGRQFGEEIEAHFMTCSAKSADNIDNLESYIITEAKRFIDEEEFENNATAAPSISSSFKDDGNSFHIKKNRPGGCLNLCSCSK